MGLCIADTMSFGMKHGRQIVAELILYLPLLLEGDSLVVERHGTVQLSTISFTAGFAVAFSKLFLGRILSIWSVVSTLHCALP